MLHTLYERFGVTEYNNEKYHKIINGIVQNLKNNRSNKVECPEIVDGVLFNKLSVDFTDSLSWLKILNIYYNIDDFISLYRATDSYGLTPTQRTDKDHKYIKIENGVIQVASIFIFVDLNDYDFKQTYTVTLLHEIAHIYKNLKLNYNQELIKNRENLLRYDLSSYEISKIINIEENDVKDLSVDDTYALLKYMIYYANIGENHAFLENIYFEMSQTLTDYHWYIHHLRLRKKEINEENILKYSSNTLYEIIWLYNLCSELRKKDIEFSNEFNVKYANELSDILEKKYNYKSIVYLISKRLKHIIEMARKIKDDYMNLYNTDKIQINESYRDAFIRKPKRRIEFPIMI